jgi:hypothetical protein
VQGKLQADGLGFSDGPRRQNQRSDLERNRFVAVVTRSNSKGSERWEALQPRACVTHGAEGEAQCSRRETDRARALTMVSTNAPPSSIMPPSAHSSKRRGRVTCFRLPTSTSAHTVREIQSAAIIAGEQRQFLAARVAPRQRHAIVAFVHTSRTREGLTRFGIQRRGSCVFFFVVRSQGAEGPCQC